MNLRRITVVGAGIIGVTTAHALRADGHEVTLVDAAPRAASGTSQANGGFLSAAFCAPWAVPGLPRQAMAALIDREAPIRWRPDGSLAQLRWLRALLAHCTPVQFARHRRRMVRLALLSRACLHEVRAETGVAFDLHEGGVLQLFREAPAEATRRQRLAELQAWGIDARWCEPDEVRALEPALSGTAGPRWALHVHDDASGDCERFAQGLLAWNRARGLKFEAGVRIDALEFDAGGRRLRTLRSDGVRWDADAFVFAAGVESACLLHPRLHPGRRLPMLPVLPVKGYSITAPLPRSGGRATGPQHAVIDDATKLALVRLGNRVRLAGMAEVVGHDRRIDTARCAQLVRQYEALYGPLPVDGRSLWAGLRPMTPDGTPIIGATAIEGLYLNTGHGTYGWTLACGSARLLADMIAGRPTPLEPDDYALDPGRREANP